MYQSNTGTVRIAGSGRFQGYLNGYFNVCHSNYSFNNRHNRLLSTGVPEV